MEVGLLPAKDGDYFKHTWPMLFYEEEFDSEFLENHGQEEDTEEWMEMVKADPMHFDGEF